MEIKINLTLTINTQNKGGYNENKSHYQLYSILVLPIAV
ncbi:hypothetical protein ASZ90_003215 [hydrocarbon metagenome]|uniref:Uncharacterized protein n=1 Tax=hydrocarbon metagenome TaxID=938273 RepID=A0A0W8G1E0_9ZZZZ